MKKTLILFLVFCLLLLCTGCENVEEPLAGTTAETNGEYSYDPITPPLRSITRYDKYLAYIDGDTCSKTLSNLLKEINLFIGEAAPFSYDEYAEMIIISGEHACVHVYRKDHEGSRVHGAVDLFTQEKMQNFEYPEQLLQEDLKSLHDLMGWMDTIQENRFLGYRKIGDAYYYWSRGELHTIFFETDYYVVSIQAEDTHFADASNIASFLKLSTAPDAIADLIARANGSK